MSFSTLKTPIKTIYSNNSNQLLRCRYLQRVFQSIIKFHDCSLVTTTITIVWSTENRYYIPVMAPVISLQGKKKGHKNTFYSLIYITKCDSTQKTNTLLSKRLEKQQHCFLDNNNFLCSTQLFKLEPIYILKYLAFCKQQYLSHQPLLLQWL